MIFNHTAEEVSDSSLWTEEEMKENVEGYSSHYGLPFSPSMSLYDWLYDEWNQMTASEPFWAPEKEEEMRERMKDLRVIVRHASLLAAHKRTHSN